MPPQNPNFAVTGIAHLQGESICRAPQRARPFAPVTKKALMMPLYQSQIGLSGQLGCFPSRFSVVSVFGANTYLSRTLKNALLDEITLRWFEQLNDAIAVFKIRLKRVQDL